MLREETRWTIASTFLLKKKQTKTKEERGAHPLVSEVEGSEGAGGGGGDGEDSASSCSLSSKPNVTSTSTAAAAPPQPPTITTGGVSALGDAGGSDAARRSGTRLSEDQKQNFYL